MGVGREWISVQRGWGHAWAVGAVFTSIVYALTHAAGFVLNPLWAIPIMIGVVVLFTQLPWVDWTQEQVSLRRFRREWLESIERGEWGGASGSSAGNLRALASAASVSDSDALEAQLDSGANPDATDPAGQTLLMLAAASGNLPVTRLLVDAGADINAASSDCLTALMCATQREELRVVEFLVERGADIRARDLSGRAAEDFVPTLWLRHSRRLLRRLRRWHPPRLPDARG
jgi:hypothetical protein